MSDVVDAELEATDVVDPQAEVSEIADFWDQALLSVDAKGRVSMPVADREAFGETGGFLVWINDHIALMSKAQWRRYYESFEGDEDLSPQDLAVLSSMASTFKLDPQGRLVISQRLRDLAGIEKQVQFIGARSHICLYSPETWAAISSPSSESARKISLAMATTRIS